MDKFILLSPFLTLCCITVVYGGAVPYLDVRGRSSETVQDELALGRSTALEFAGPGSQAAQSQGPPVSSRRAFPMQIGPRSSAIEGPLPPIVGPRSVPIESRSTLQTEEEIIARSLGVPIESRRNGPLTEEEIIAKSLGALPIPIGPRSSAVGSPGQFPPPPVDLRSVPIESRDHHLLPEEEIIAKSMGASVIGPRNNAIPPPEEIFPRSIGAAIVGPRSNAIPPAEEIFPRSIDARSNAPTEEEIIARSLGALPVGPRSNAIPPPEEIFPRSTDARRNAPTEEEIIAKSLGALPIGPRSNAILPPEEQLSPRAIGPLPPILPIEERSSADSALQSLLEQSLSARSGGIKLFGKSGDDSPMQSVLEQSVADTPMEPVGGKRRHHTRRFNRRRFGGVSDMQARTSYLHKRDELMERLRLELQEWHDKRHGYVNPRGVGGKSLLSTVSTIVSLMNTLLPWFGIRPPQPMMSSGGGMMSSSEGMMSSSGGMMSSSGGNIVLVPLTPF